MKKAVILIHGFCENCEISFSQFLSSTNFRRYDIIKYTISGHNPEVDEEFEYKKEINRINLFVEDIVNKYDSVDVIGFSLGGALASYVASKYKINRLVVIGPAFKYLTSIDISKNFMHALKDIAHTKNLKDGIQKYIDENITHKESIFMDLKDFNIHEFPSITNFVKIIDVLKDETGYIDCPTLIIHGEHDELIPISSSLFVLNKVTNKNKFMIVAPDSMHRVLASDNAAMYYALIEKFIKKGKIKIKHTR